MKAREEDTDIRQQAISDCKYAKSLGETALMQHIIHWGKYEGAQVPLSRWDLQDIEYHNTMFEIADKLNTPECLLEN